MSIKRTYVIFCSIIIVLFDLSINIFAIFAVKIVMILTFGRSNVNMPFERQYNFLFDDNQIGSYKISYITF